MSKVKFTKQIRYELERYPECCAECPAFYTTEYFCHNERGCEGNCELGYMKHSDMRDFSGRYLFNKCDIKNNSNVKLMKINNEKFYYELHYFRGRKDTGSIYIKTERSYDSMKYMDEDDFLNALVEDGTIDKETANEITDIYNITEEEYNNMTGGN